MQIKLARIAEIAKEKSKEKFTSLYQLLNQGLLTQCHQELDGNKATGVDQVTKAAYEENLESNIRFWSDCLHIIYRLWTVMAKSAFVQDGMGTDT